MEFQLQVRMDNAAFAVEWGYEADHELSRILHDVARHFGSALEPVSVVGTTGRILDYNGNTVGAWKITEGR